MASVGTRPRAQQAAPLGLEAPLGNPRYPLFDGLRAIAVVLVLVRHLHVARPLPGLVGKFASHGQSGVAIFFLISGFLLYRPFVTARLGRARAIEARTFYSRRLLRIVPAYWVALTLLAIYPGLNDFDHHWWRMYSFSQIYWKKSDIGIYPAWSLCIEMSFYALLPLYAYGVARLSRRAMKAGGSRWLAVELAGLGLLGAASVGYHQTFPGGGHPILLGAFYLFAAGMGLAAITVAWDGTRFPTLVSRYASASWAFAILFYIGLAVAVSANSIGSTHPAYAILALALLLPATVQSDSLPARVLRLRVVAWIGLVSYAIYIWQRNLIVYFSAHIRSTVLVMLVSTAATVTIAALSYYVVEAPFLRLKARLARVTSRSATAGA